MELSKKQKLWLGALGLAIAVFVADRIFPGGTPAGPDEVEATVTSESPEMIQVDEANSQPDEEIRAAEVRSVLAKRLDTVARTQRLSTAKVKDAFCPSSSWVGSQRTKTVVDQEPQVKSLEARAQEFAEAHQLQAVAVSSGRSLAIIDGRCLQIGQQIDGFALVSITDNAATLSCEGVKVTLKIKTDDGKSQ